jgi:RNA polymerase sigma-70 factor (sigma-E family)
MGERRRSDATAPPGLTDFVDDQYARVAGALAMYTGDAALAADLAQEAFIRVCQRWEQVSVMDAPGAWVHRVAMNLAKSAYRRRGAEARAVARDASTTPPTGGAVGNADRALDVRRAVAGLAAPERAVIVLRFFADLSVADTATALGIPVGTVKTRTRRAVDQLRSSGIDAEVAIDG